MRVEMRQPMHIGFADKMPTFDTFVDAVAARVAHYLKEERNDPEYMSKRCADKMFGRGNVERWIKAGKVEVSRRPGKMDLKVSDMRLCQRTEQDYL